MEPGVRIIKAWNIKAAINTGCRTEFGGATRPEVFSGTSISQGAQYLGDEHGQFARSGGPRIAHRGGPVEPVLLLDKEDFDDTNTK